ncbi:MAG: glycine--tRNA ligase subunit beta [Gammaproteobacteria bacterium]|nr:glycine--tRNA ligase subunit beta [Gammaproteobacteria bacterium]
MAKQTLLLEIGTEELPPKALLKLATAFANGMREGLEKAELAFTEVEHYATPRRLTVMITALDAAQADKEVLKRGPAIKDAYDDAGKPTPAALGFAKSCDADISELETMETDKGSWLTYLALEKGKATVELITEIAETALSRLPIPKRMRWGTGSVEFVRPVHWVVAMFGTKIIDCSILGIKAGDQTFGHRFHHPAPIQLKSAESYLQQLEETGKVFADFNQRKTIIREAVNKVADEVNGQAVVDENLLDEVTSLVEWPVVISGIFDKKYLALPNEVLIATMQGHQKYFPVVDSENNLLPRFITVANIESKSPDVIRQGNQRVITPRLSDAEFFWQRDNETTLADLRTKLADVVFQQKLGSLHDKSERITSLATTMANLLGADRKLAERAAALSKCDLLTDMVAELPELQGVIGRYYAINNGEDKEVATALDEQYMPRFAGDQIPQTKTGQIISIADKLDTLVGIFAIGKAPTGDKDPFALRRAALGVLRIMIEGKLELDLDACLKEAVENYADLAKGELAKDELVSQVFDFMMERLRRYYVDQNISVDNFEAVLMRKPVQPYDFHRRLNAVVQFRKLPEAESLAAANKRIGNILKQVENQDNIQFSDGLLKEDAEQKLAAALNAIIKKVTPLLDNSEYEQALSELAGLKNDVDTFFDDVMVLCDDVALKNNRLALLSQLSNLFLKTADISRLQD